MTWPETIAEGQKVTVLLNPKAGKEKRIYVEGRVVNIVDTSEGTQYRVKYKCSWGYTSGWYHRDELF